MNKTRTITALCLALAFFAGTVLAAPPQYWNDPAAACDHSKTVDRTLRNLQRDGFELQTADEQPIYYFIPPTGDHVWGSLTFTFIRSQGGYSLETDYAIVTAEVSYFDGMGFKVTRVTVEEYTVF